jgi:hypothetical protein
MKKNTEVLLVTNKVVGLEASTDESACVTECEKESQQSDRE